MLQACWSELIAIVPLVSYSEKWIPKKGRIIQKMKKASTSQEILKNGRYMWKREVKY